MGISKGLEAWSELRLKVNYGKPKLFIAINIQHNSGRTAQRAFRVLLPSLLSPTIAMGTGLFSHLMEQSVKR